MPDFIGNFGEVVSRGINELTGKTLIRHMTPGGTARAILEILGKEMENLSNIQDANLRKAFLPTTYGQFLDHFGATVGLAKYPQRNAEALSTDRVFKFSVRNGATFGSINAGNGFTISAGTILTSPASSSIEEASAYSDIDTPDSIGDRSVHFSTSTDVWCGPLETEVYVGAAGLTPGRDANLAIGGMVSSHNFVSYSDYIARSLLITNERPLLNGTDEETTASFRYRISKALTAAEKANNVAITNAVLAIPGVADLIILPYDDGIGRFNVYIKSISSVVSDKTVEDVQLAIDEVSAVGNKGYARKPYEVGIEIDSTLIYRQAYDADTKAQIRESLIVAAISYLNSLDLGQPLIASDLEAELRQVDNRILAVGNNRTTFFDSLFAYYPARLVEGGRRREKIISSTLVVPLHARIISETTISDPVRFV